MSWLKKREQKPPEIRFKAFRKLAVPIKKAMMANTLITSEQMLTQLLTAAKEIEQKPEQFAKARDEWFATMLNVICTNQFLQNVGLLDKRNGFYFEALEYFKKYSRKAAKEALKKSYKQGVKNAGKSDEASGRSPEHE